MRKICTLSFGLLAIVFAIIGLNHHTYRLKATPQFTQLKNSLLKIKKTSEAPLELIVPPTCEYVLEHYAVTDIEAHDFENISQTKYSSHYTILPHSPPHHS